MAPLHKISPFGRNDNNGLGRHAAVLLFGKAPQRFLPSSEIKCLHFHGTEVRKPIPSYQIYKGTVFELANQALDFVMSKIARAVGTRAAGPAAPVDYELPREAVAEAIVNAIAHRDYASDASVQVMLLADRLEIWNPGQLPAPLTIETLSRPHASIPHNPLIAEPLFLARYIEKSRHRHPRHDRPVQGSRPAPAPIPAGWQRVHPDPVAPQGRDRACRGAHGRHPVRDQVGTKSKSL